jgi:predicted ester cyclase
VEFDLMENTMRALATASLIYLTVLSSASAADLEANKQLYRGFIEDVWNKRDPSAADRYLAPNFVEHNPNLPPGLAGRKEFAESVQAAFSDYHAEIQEVLAEGDMVVARVLWTGTQDGPYRGRPPTGKRLRFSTADFFRVESGKLAEHWDVVDSLSRAIALGLVPAPKAPGETTAPRTP